MRTDRRKPGPNARVADHATDGLPAERSNRRVDPQEHRATLALATAAQIRHQRFADIDRQREHVQTIALPADQDLTSPPVHVLAHPC